VCGIVGAAARRDIVPVLVEGLRRLEYRGYDSCGVATIGDRRLARVRSVARVEDLAGQIRKQKLKAETGIAHTRWATHGAPVTRNAHPMVSRDEIAVVHNGIIENYEELRAGLKAKGYAFDSQTDTEVIAHLVHSHYSGDLFEADIKPATVVTLYLLTDLNLKLRPRLLKELNPGTRVVSHAFSMGDWTPERTAEVQGTHVYLWRIPPRKA